MYLFINHQIFPYIPIAQLEDEFDTDESQWVSIVISEYLFEWRNSPLTNHGIQINVTVQGKFVLLNEIRYE